MLLNKKSKCSSLAQIVFGISRNKKKGGLTSFCSAFFRIQLLLQSKNMNAGIDNRSAFCLFLKINDFQYSLNYGNGLFSGIFLCGYIIYIVVGMSLLLLIDTFCFGFYLRSMSVPSAALVGT